MRRNKGQVLLFVFFLLAVVSFLVGALSTIWEAKVKVGALQKKGITAFYLAQAGVERAKYELKNNWNWTGILEASKVSLGDGFYWVELANRDDTSPAVYREVTVTGHGQIGDINKTISVRLRVDIGVPNSYSQVNLSWVEN
ncbi:MAG: hypothetical protein WC695_07265 [Candidatus Omnitrophota bacterium]